MDKVARYLVGILGGLLLTTGSAAADRTMVVVVDATGSMTAIRGDGETRFEAAKTLAADRVFTAATVETEGLSGVAVFTFHNTPTASGLVAESTGFVSPSTAVGIINGLTMPTGTTPLAGSMCDAIDIASTSGSASTTTRFLSTYTDGGENDTDPTHACAGPYSVSSTPPYDLGSWQNLVYTHALDASPAVTIDATLLYNDTSALRLTPRLSDEDFFAHLSRDTGGTFAVVDDDAPVPVFADVDGDYDVDRDDAIALALSFGGPASVGLDLDADGNVGFTDYEVVLSRFGSGHNPAEADPYTQADTVTCGRRNERVVINGKVIEDAGVTISVRGECTVVIRNSLIVSGQTAVRVRGGADLVVEDSIIVGEGAWLDSRGTTSVSASGSIFHGAQEVRGDFDYEDLGGNTFSLPGDGTESGGPDSLAGADGGLGMGCSAGGGARSSLWLALLVAVIAVRRRRRR